MDPIAHEIEQLIGICDHMNHAIERGPSEQLEGNAYLEAFVVHVRVLTDFFEHSAAVRGTRDYVLGLDYGLPAQYVGLHASLRRRIRKDVMHLTYARAQQRRVAGRDWFLDDMAGPLLARCDEFAAHVLGGEAGLALTEADQDRYNLIRRAIAKTLREGPRVKLASAATGGIATQDSYLN